MKKLKLNFQQLKADVLTREQLKKVMGGDQGSGGSCQSGGQMCYRSLNCCSGYACNVNHVCWWV